MAKKKNVVDTSAARPLTHNPFAALGPVKPFEEAPREEASRRAPEPAPIAEPLRLTHKIVVRRETKGRAGKTVTRIRGLPATHREALADRMKRALGCGASIDGDDVLLLGSLVERAADWLAAQGATRVVRSP
ncbi:MAG TPA: translation initiation factor [Sandaracinaceae bacterium]